MYSKKVAEKIIKTKQKSDILVLGIESSCDETSVSVVKNGREVLSNIISSQIEIHKRFGGVVPEVASRNHVLAIQNVYDEALNKAGVCIDDIDVIAVTYGAGLLGALMVGVSFAKGLAFAHNKPLIAVNHIRGHICGNYIEHNTLQPPFICLVVSGGHTAILKVTDYTEFKALGSTIDDAVGEAFDKVARVMGLPYPGGPQVDKLSKLGEINIEFVKSDNLKKSFNSSFSGLKTAVINYIHKKEQKKEKYNINDVCASFSKEAILPLVEKSIRACKENKISTLCLAGGVAANSYLRQMAKEYCDKEGIKLTYPKLELCTDNAAMIASAGYFYFLAGKNIADLNLDAVSNLPL